MAAKSSGFTLLELMLAVSIIGILAAIAYPSFNKAIIKAQRMEAAAKLHEVAQRQERFYMEKNTYASSLQELGYPSSPLGVGKGGYWIHTAVPATAGTTIASSFMFTAVADGKQIADIQCGNLTLDHTGVKGISGTGKPEACW